MIYIIGIIFIAIVLYLLKTNNDKFEVDNHQKGKLLLILITILKGLILCMIVGYITAYFIIVNNGEVHPHGMIELLYVWLSLGGAITGIIVGLILAIFETKNINIKLLIGSLIFIVIILLWWKQPL